MKLITILLFSSLFARGQSISIKYVSNGQIEFRNWMDCDAQVKVLYLGENYLTDTTLKIQALTIKSFQGLSNPKAISFKSELPCTTWGWITIYPPPLLIVKP